MARILIVDDEKGLLESIREYLTANGHEVVTASSAADALPLLDSEEFDAVVSDIVMPGISGVDLIREVQNRQKDTRSILMTGHPSVETAIDAIRLGVVDYITKPIRMGELKDILDNAVASKGDARKSREQRARLETLVEQQSSQLHETLERYYDIFNAVTDAIIIYTHDGVIVEANASATRMFGYEHDEFVGMDGPILAADKDDYREFMSLVNDGKPCSLDTRGIHKDGAILWLEVAGKRFNYNGKPHIAAIIKDITQRQQALAALKKFETLVDHSSDFVGLASIEGQCLYLNAAGRKMVGLPLDVDVRSLRVEQFLDVESRRLLEKTIIPAVRATGHWAGEDRLRNFETGELIAVHNDTFLLPDDFAASTGNFATVMHDIRDRVKYEEQLQTSNEQLEVALQGSVQAMANLLETRDPYTAGHQKRVAWLARLIAESLGFSKEVIEGLYIAGVVHDVGKISVPTEILSKPGRLTDLEFKIIMQHSQRGYDILKPVHFPWPVADIVVQHHERLDGSGYPNGITGEHILAEARVLMVADVVEAITSHRPYRAALGMDVAFDVLKKERGTKLDADVVDACLDIITKPDFTFE